MKSGIFFEKCSGTGTLSGQFKLGIDSVTLPLSEGEYRLALSIDKGKARLIHSQYLMDGLEIAPFDRPGTYDFHEVGTYTIVFRLLSVNGITDRVQLINLSMRKPLTFKFSLEKIS